MRTWLPLLVLLCVGFIGASLLAWASEKQEPRPSHSLELSALMRAKLASSQKITEGLVVKDFDLIRKGARNCDKSPPRPGGIPLTIRSLCSIAPS